MNALSLRTLLPLAAMLVAACGQASGSAPPAQTKAGADARDVVATVNGAPITQLDVRLRLGRDGHKEAQESAPSAPQLANVVETVIGEELAAQRAAELGLDADPKYREGLQKLEAQVVAYRRKALSELFWERSVDKSAAPSDAEARQFFEANRRQIGTALRVRQIMRRGEASIEEVRQKLERGARFEEVAASLFPSRRPDETPWDLGWMSWYKLPEAWRKVAYELKPGEVSGVIRGPNDRYWMIEVVDRREDAEVSFDAAKPAILADLRRGRLEAARERARAELREKARIQRLAPATVAARAAIED